MSFIVKRSPAIGRLLVLALLVTSLPIGPGRAAVISTEQALMGSTNASTEFILASADNVENVENLRRYAYFLGGCC